MKTYTEQEIKAICTPDIIKRMVELAEGFDYIDKYKDRMINYSVFPLLIHRAVEGWNKKIELNGSLKIIVDYDYERCIIRDKTIKLWQHYQPQSLTQSECACLHCLIEILKEK